MLAEQLVARGHQVVWWTSAFDHFNRRLRTPVNVPIPLGSHLTLWQLEGATYRRNVSLARMRNHWQVARAFRKLAAMQTAPDVIVSSLPTVELCAEAVDYARIRNIPVALDIRDLWPDVVLDLMPRPLRPAGRVATWPMRRQLIRAATGATALLGLTDEFVQWARDAAGREAGPWDRVFPMAYSSTPPPADELKRAKGFWDRLGIDGRDPIVCFFGTLGWMFDFETVVAAAALLRARQSPARFVLCGGGERMELLRRQSDGAANVILAGRVGQAEIWELMRRSIAGLAPYRSFRNFDDNLPNKPIEYLSASLPIIASDVKVLRRLLTEHECGITYRHGDAVGLADAVSRLLSSAERRESMSRRAHRLYQSKFVAEQVYRQMALHLETVARRR